MSTPPAHSDIAVSKPRRRRRRWRLRLGMSLRGFMGLVLVVGGGLGWQIHRVRTQQLAVAAILAAGGKVLYDYQYSSDPARMKAIGGVMQPAAPQFLRRWLGDDWFRTAVCVEVQAMSGSHPEVLVAIGRLDGLTRVRLEGMTESAAAWGELGRLRRLEEAAVIGPCGTDEAVAALCASRSLRDVRLFGASVTDEGLAPLARLGALRTLAVEGPRVTDAGMARLLASSRSPGLDRLAWLGFARPVPGTVRTLARYHPNLQHLTLSLGPLADADLAPIGALKGLKSLDLTRTTITAAALVHLEPLAQLQSLAVDRRVLTGRGLKSVRKLQNLGDLGPR